jgi:hypothetical protein
VSETVQEKGAEFLCAPELSFVVRIHCPEFAPRAHYTFSIVFLLRRRALTGFFAPSAAAPPSTQSADDLCCCEVKEFSASEPLSTFTCIFLNCVCNCCCSSVILIPYDNLFSYIWVTKIRICYESVNSIKKKYCEPR